MREWLHSGPLSFALTRCIVPEMLRQSGKDR